MTESQDYHHEIRLLITTYMIHNSSNPKLSCLLPASESKKCYVRCSNLQCLGTWETEIERIAIACLLQMPIYVCEKSTNGKSIHQLMQLENGGDLHLDECIVFQTLGLILKQLKNVTLHEACVILHTSSSFRQSFNINAFI